MLQLLAMLMMYLGGLPAYGSPHVLSRGPGAAAAASGDSVVATVEDATALYWNPAGLVRAGGSVSAEHLFLYDGARYNFMALAVPSRWGAFGLGALQLHRGNIVARSAIDDPGRQVSNTQTAYMVGYARNLGSAWSLGATGNMLDLNLAGHTGRGFGLDAGTRAAFPGPELGPLQQTVVMLGAAIKNLLEPRLRLLEEQERIPREFRLGAGLSFKAFSRASNAGLIRHDRAALTLAFRRAAGDRLVPGFGLSYSLQDMLVLRLGYSGEISAGFGFHTSDGKFVVDYAIENRPLSRNHRFTLSYRFLMPGAPPIAPAQQETDEDYARARGRAEAMSAEFFAKGQEALRAGNSREAREALHLAAVLAPERRERAGLYRRVAEIYRRERVRDLREKIDGAAAPAALFQGLLELQSLEPSATEELGRRFSRIAESFPDEYAVLASELLDRRSEELGRWLEAGFIADAREGLAQLAAVAGAPAAERLAGLRTRIEAEAASLKRRAEELIAREPSSGAAVQAVFALARAFPEDEDMRRRRQAMASAFSAGLSLSIKERFHLRKLYYLAAIAYAKREPENAADLVGEVLRRDAGDQDANALHEVVLRKKAGNERTWEEGE